MKINERFPILSTIAKLLWAIGIIVIIIGAIPFILELVEFLRCLPNCRWVWRFEDFIEIGTFVLSIVIGLFIMAVAESIGVLFAIEKNTRK